MSTTSKLGADMTDSQWILDVMGRYDFTMPQAAFDEIVRKLSARQPAAIDKQEVVTTYCPSKFGKQPHSFNHQKCGYCGVAAPLANEASKPAPSVEQDERGAFEAWARNEFDIDAGTPLFREGKGYMGLAIDAAWRAWRGSWQARAASTSANVAQGAEAVRALFQPWPEGELGPTDEPESQYRLGYNTAIEDALEALTAVPFGSDAALRNLLSHCWEFKTSFDKKTQQPTTIKATFKVTTIVSERACNDMGEIVADFLAAAQSASGDTK